MLSLFPSVAAEPVPQRMRRCLEVPALVAFLADGNTLPWRWNLMCWTGQDGTGSQGSTSEAVRDTCSPTPTYLAKLELPYHVWVSVGFGQVGKPPTKMSLVDPLRVKYYPGHDWSFERHMASVLMFAVRNINRIYDESSRF